MSTNDKTGEKLVDSIRRTKSAVKRSQDQGAAKRRTQSQARKPKPAPDEVRNGIPDPYQRGARVWPD